MKTCTGSTRIPIEPTLFFARMFWLAQRHDANILAIPLHGKEGVMGSIPIIGSIYALQSGYN